MAFSRGIYQGIVPLLASYPQALVWGANPITLVSGGTVIWLLVVGSTFWLAAKSHGLEVAGWAILPLVFSSLGTIWLSARITGGHLLTSFWHTAAFAGLYCCLRRGNWRYAAVLGLWCGLGIYVDTMFLFTLAGLAAAALFAWRSTGRSEAGIGLAALFLVALWVGLAPREIGGRLDPHDAYPNVFNATLEPRAIWEHTRLLVSDCMPRLIGNGVFPAIIVVPAFLITLIRVALDLALSTDPARKAISIGICTSALLIVPAFVLNNTISDAHSFRYLVFLLTPWALGFGLVLSDLARQGRLGLLSAWLVGALLLGSMTVPVFLWYRDEMHYVDARGMPVRLPPQNWSELTIARDDARTGQAVFEDFVVPPDVTHVYGNYWVVYKMAFLSNGRVVGIPAPFSANRFRGWSHGLGAGRGKLLVLHPDLIVWNPHSVSHAKTRGTLVRSARHTNWYTYFKLMWKMEHRDPAEANLLRVVVP